MVVLKIGDVLSRGFVLVDERLYFACKARGAFRETLHQLQGSWCYRVVISMSESKFPKCASIASSTCCGQPSAGRSPGLVHQLAKGHGSYTIAATTKASAHEH